MPFREQVINYPQHSSETAVTTTTDGKVRLHIDATALPPTHPSLTYAKLMNKPNAQNPSARNPGVPPANPKPEDKDHPDFKKKVALARGPLIAMTYDNTATHGMPESLFTALKDIFEAIYAHRSRTGVVSPTRFLEVLRRENEMFRSAMHQDAHEFLNLLLNQVVASVEDYSKKLEEAKASQNTTSESTDGSSDGSVKDVGFEQALATALPKVTNNTRWVHELFEGTLTSETKCLTCENVSQRDEAFLDLSVDLEEHTSVTSCLRKYSEEEMLCERNKFHCDRCGGLQEAEKRMKVKRLPKILALHLKRFKFTEDLQRFHKLFHRVVYPYTLRLFNTTDDAEDLDRLYELYAVVVHIGGGPHHGHYISIIKTEDRGWLLFDDEMVEPVDKSYVQNFFGDRPGLACAYVLFYQETTLEAVKREQDAESLALAQQSTVEIPKEAVGLGVKTNGVLNGIHQVKSAMSPSGPDDGMEHLDKAVSEPLHPLQSPVPDVTALPQIPTSATPTEDVKSKKERVREEKERKLKAREEAKEAERAERERRKTIEVRRKEMLRRPDTQTSNPFEANRQSILDDDLRPNQQESQSNGTIPHPPVPTPSAPTATGLSRLKSTSKSFKKPKFFGGSKELAKDEPLLSSIDSVISPDSNNQNGNPVTRVGTATASLTLNSQPTTESAAPEKTKTTRFSLKKRASQLKL